MNDQQKAFIILLTLLGTSSGLSTSGPSDGFAPPSLVSGFGEAVKAKEKAPGGVNSPETTASTTPEGRQVPLVSGSESQFQPGYGYPGFVNWEKGIFNSFGGQFQGPQGLSGYQLPPFGSSAWSPPIFPGPPYFPNNVNGPDNTISGSEPKVSVKQGLKVGIVGGGIAGLYAGLLLQSLDIDYDIYEAHHRPGGRLYTYNFESEKHDDYCKNQAYFDAGGMRFPTSAFIQNPAGLTNKSLVNYLNTVVKDETMKIKLVPFTSAHENSVNYFNGRRVLQKDVDKQSTDLFGWGSSNDGVLPDKYATRSPYYWLTKISEYFTKYIAKDFTKGMIFLQKYDNVSYREYITWHPNFAPELADYIDQIFVGSGMNQHGFTGYIRGALIEDYPNTTYFAVEGGMNEVVKAMVSVIRGQLYLQSPVKSVTLQDDQSKLEIRTDKASATYDDVILTPTFPALRDIKFRGFNISYIKRRGLRILHYVQVSKVGILFDKRWWQDNEIMRGKPIFGGRSCTDLPVSFVVFPSFGLNCTDYPAVVIASYSYEYDTAFLTGRSDSDVVEVALDNLSEMFAVDVRKYYSGKYYVHRWHNTPYIRGGFAQFESNQYNYFIRGMQASEANGRIHMASDGTGIYRGWSYDATVNSYWAVREVLERNNLKDKIELLKQLWIEPRENREWVKSLKKPI